MAVLTIQNTLRHLHRSGGQAESRHHINGLGLDLLYTKVVLTTKVLFAPRFAFSSFIPPWLRLHPIYMRPEWITHKCCVRYGTVISSGPWHHCDVDRVKKSSPKAITELSVEMMRPR